MTITVNIGLARNDGRADNTVAEVLKALGDSLNYVAALRTAQSDTEKTLIVQYDFVSLNPTFLYGVCADLAQDCVAVRNDITGGGILVGPNAAKWGDFNPDYFLGV